MTTIINPPGPVAVDFETYYDKVVSIKTMGPDAYLRHPKTDIYLVSIVGDDGEEFVGHPEDFDWECLVGRELWSHNAAFDRLVYFYFRRQRNPTLPDLETSLWNCTANLSVYFRSGRSLKAASLSLLGEEITKDVRDAMCGVTAKQAKVKPALSPAFANLYDEVCAYALSDSRQCLKLAKEYSPRWPDLERHASEMTIRICHQGLPMDEEELEIGQTFMERLIWEKDRVLPWITGLTADQVYDTEEKHMVLAGGRPPLSPKGLAEACRLYQIPPPPSLAEDNPKCAAWENEYGKQYTWVTDMRDRRKAGIVLKNIEKMRARTRDGWMPYGMKYYGAHTGRWQGDSGFNVKNMPKEPFRAAINNGDDFFIFDLRGCIKPPEGYSLILADLSQIEARITPYLAGDEETMRLIREGMNVYEVHARVTMGWTGGKLKEEAKELYALAKARVLALGFGCGWQRFRDQAQMEYGLGLDWAATKFKKEVDAFRESNPKIRRLWNRLDKDFKASEGGNFELELPSNRVMTYFDVRRSRKPAKESDDITPKKNNVGYQAATEMGGRHKFIYGGLLCENLVQATARDLFLEKLCWLDNERFQIILHVYDEAVLMVRTEDAEAAKTRVEEIMSAPVDWLPGCPIACEAKITKVYEK